MLIIAAQKCLHPCGFSRSAPPLSIMTIRGIPIQCHTYALSKAFPPTSEPLNSANRMSLCAVIPSCSPKGPSCPSNGVARAIFVLTVMTIRCAPHLCKFRKIAPKGT